MSMGDFINKAKEMISEHPDQARDALNRAEQMLNQQTGGKYADQITKGGDMLEGRLGFPDEQTQPADPQADSQTDAQPPAQPSATEDQTLPQTPADAPETAGPSAQDSTAEGSVDPSSQDQTITPSEQGQPAAESGDDVFGLNPKN